MWHIIAENNDPRVLMHRDQFKIDAKDTQIDGNTIMFSGFGTRASIGRELTRLRTEHPGIRFTAFWTPDWLIGALIDVGAKFMRLSHDIHAYFEQKDDPR